MVGTTPKIDRHIQGFGRRLTGRIRVDRILLFGSRARGEALHESDIDLAVISPDFKDLLWYRRMEMLAREWGYGPWAEIFGYTPEELQSADPLTFVGQIRETGKVVFMGSKVRPESTKQAATRSKATEDSKP